MTTRVKIGPRDHGMPLSLEEFLAADGEEGYHYELIHGRLYVCPAPNARKLTPAPISPIYYLTTVGGIRKRTMQDSAIVGR